MERLSTHTNAAFAIDGLVPDRVVPVSTKEAVGEVLQDAARDGLVVAPLGGRGAMHLGNALARYDIALDLTGLNRVLAYHPTDLVLSVEAGVTFAEVAALLAEHGQELPLDCPHPERATIGGLIATGLSGPRRYGAGSLRDLLIGISVVHSDGSAASAGGMVVKNVSGFDMMRLHHGALGSLGVTVSANFKVLPKPKAEATVQAAVADPDGAFSVIEALRPVTARPRAIVLTRRDSGWQLSARYDGRPASVREQSAKAIEAIGNGSTLLETEESAAWWQGYADSLARKSDHGFELRLGSAPATCRGALERVLQAERELDVSFETLTLWPTLGAVIARTSAERADLVAQRLLPSLWSAREMTALLFDAPPDIKRQLDVYGPNWSQRTLEAVRALKVELDPTNTLNRGRLPGRI